MDSHEYKRTVLNVSDNHVIPDYSYNYTAKVDFEDQNPSYDFFDDQSEIYIIAAFVIVYSAIFVIGLFGNSMILCSVLRQKSMQTVTNILICNLALANIILCIFNLPIMPVSLFVIDWPFGSTMCHLTPCIVGTAFFASTLSLAAIAVHRYLVIVHPLKQQINNKNLIAIISCMWIISAAVSVPDGLNHRLIDSFGLTCFEVWPIDLGVIYFAALFLVKFVFPYGIIISCYAALSGNMKIADRSRADGTEEFRRNRRTNRLLIAMAVTFSICWIPLQVGHLIISVTTYTYWHYIGIEYGLLNVIALSSTCFNPLFYKWLNNFTNKQFCQVWPCFRHQSGMHTEDDVAGAYLSRNAPVGVTYDAYSEKINVKSSK